MSNMSIREFLRRWDAGEFDASRQSMCDAGWYDWFCTDRGLYGRLKKMVPCVRRLAESSKIDQDRMYVFFKNNCPMWVNETYDDFRICDLETGDVLYTVAPRYPTVKKESSGRRFGSHKTRIQYFNEVWDFVADEEEKSALIVQNLAQGKKIDYDECVVMGTRDEVYDYFGV